MRLPFDEYLDRCRNPVMEWFREHKPGIISAIDKLGITAAQAECGSWERIRLTFLVEDDAITREEALEQGLTAEELKDFDEQIDTDNLISVIDWRICEYPLR